MTPFKFYLLTDTHCFEPSLGAEGKTFEEYMKREQFFLKESSQIVKATFERLAEDEETEAVIFAGELSKNGEKESNLSKFYKCFQSFNFKRIPTTMSV